MYARMRGITPAWPQFETRPLLLDVIELPQPLNKTGLYSREAFSEGNTIPIFSHFLFIPSLYASFLKFVGFFIYLYKVMLT